MMTLIVLLVYVSGVYLAYYQIQKWADHDVKEGEEYQTLHMLSLLSWLIYPIYGLVWIFRKCREE